MIGALVIGLAIVSILIVLDDGKDKDWIQTGFMFVLGLASLKLVGTGVWALLTEVWL